MIEIIRGVQQGAVKLVLYGPEGIGKSTFASKAPRPLFIDTEGSTKTMDVSRTPTPKYWEDILALCDEVAKDPSICDTLVIDTADWAEQLCIKYTCEKGKVDSIEGFGYGKGYTYVQENFMKLLEYLDKVIAAGVNVIITAHAKMRKFEQPDEMGAYDRWEMKLTRQVAPILKEWADIVLFANYKTFVVTDDKTKSKKAQGGKRVMYATHNPCWDAKNRHGLPDMMDFGFEPVAGIFKAKNSTPAPAPAQPAKEPDPLDPINGEPESVSYAYMELRKLMDEAHITADEVQLACVNKNLQPDKVPVWEYSEEFINEKLIGSWEGFRKHVNKKYSDMPFIKHWADVTEGGKNNG